MLGSGSAAIADIRGGVSAGEITVTTLGGMITDSSVSEAANLTAFAAALRSGTGMGDTAGVEDLDTSLSRMALVTHSGDIAIDNVGNLEVGTVDGLSGLVVSDTENNNSGADHLLVTTTGSLTIQQAVVDHDGGSITLTAEGTGTGADLTVAANITATGGSGSVRLFAGDDLLLTSGTLSTAGAGAFGLSAGETHDGVSGAAGNASGDLVMGNGTLIQATTGNVGLEATGSIALSRVTTSGALFVSADDHDFGLANNVGAITDNTAAEGPGGENLVGDDMDLRAATGIGHQLGTLGDIGDIDLAAVTLNAVNITSGRMQLVETNAVAVRLLSNTGRSIVLDAGGAITDGNGNTALDNVVSQALVLRAVGGIGSLNALEIGVSDLAFANTGSGDVQLNDTGGVTMTSLGGLNASSNTAGFLSLSSTGPVTFAAHTTSSGSLTVTTSDGTVSNTENISVNAGVTVKSTGGNLLFQAGDRISLAASSTVEATLGSVMLSSGFGDSDSDGSQVLNGLVTAADRITIQLSAEAGSATEGSSGSLVAPNLLLLSTGTGSFSLGSSSTNNVATLAAATDGLIIFRDANSISVGTVGGTSGITTTDDDVTLTLLAGSLSIGDAVGALGADDIALGSGHLTLNAPGAVTQTAGSDVTAQGLKLLGTGTFALENASNNVSTLAGNVGGTVAYRDADSLTIGTVLGTNGIMTTNDNVTVCLVTGNLLLSQDISTGTAGMTMGIVRL